MKKIVSAVLIVLVVAGGVLFVVKKRELVASLPTPAPKAVAVDTAEPRKMRIEQKSGFLGRYYSLEHPQVASKISGFIERIHVREGDRVKRGDLLVSIDAKEIRASIKAQRASVEAAARALEALKVTLKSLRSDYLYAKEVYERDLSLYEAAALSKEKMERSRVAMELKQAAYLSAQKSLEAKAQDLAAVKAQLLSKTALLNYADLRSPIEAEVGKIFLRAGDLAVPGKPILTLLGKRKVVEFLFARDPKNRVERGMKARVGGLEADISKILPQSERSLWVARISLDEPLEVPENGTIEVEVVQKSLVATAVPVSSILHRGEESFIFEYIDNVFVPKKVKVVASDGTFAAVEPKPSHKVAVASSDKLSRLFFIKDARAAGNE